MARPTLPNTSALRPAPSHAEPPTADSSVGTDELPLPPQALDATVAELEVEQPAPAGAQDDVVPEDPALHYDAAADVVDADHHEVSEVHEVGDYHEDDYHEDDYHEDDYVDLPPEGRLPRWAGVLLVFVLLITVVVGAGAWWYRRQINPPGSPGAVVSVSIPRGASLSGIGSILAREGVVPNGIIFNYYAGRKNAGPFEAGVYELRKNSDIDLVLDTMAKGPTGELKSAEEVIRVSIPEGLTIDAIIARIAGQVPRFDLGKLNAALDDGKVKSSLKPSDQKSYEGLLFPATYELGGTESEVDFLNKLAAEMETRVQRNDVTAAKARVKSQFGIDVSEYDLLTVASLVQAEAGNAEEAPKIATVIYNRLKADTTALTLGIDAVDDYGAALAGTDPATFRATAQPYNTRLVKGLPPTPISASGDYALTAAFAPADGPWIYYVLTDPGVHSFAVTNAEFQQFKQECKAKDLGCG